MTWILRYLPAAGLVGLALYWLSVGALDQASAALFAALAAAGLRSPGTPVAVPSRAETTTPVTVPPESPDLTRDHA